MSLRHRRAATARLLIVTTLLLAAIWLLYRHFIAIAPAPPPSITHSGAILSPTSDI